MAAEVSARSGALLLVCVVVALAAQQSSSAAEVELPPAPAKCTPKIRASIAWGAGSCAAKIEGAAREGGRAPSVWDAWIQAKPRAIVDGSTPDIAADFYHRYKQDVALMQQLGLKHFRMSISWSRLLPGARRGSAINPEAVRFYSGVLDRLRAAGIQPMVVLYHWDLPQALQEAYQGFLSPDIVDDFAYFADTCFRLFGDRVRRWLTFIEPLVICSQQYGAGTWAPGVNTGDAGRFKCGHNVLLAHATAVQLYRTRYAASQRGALSFSTLFTWPMPADPSSPADARAAQNKLDAEAGWLLDPVFFGDYPASLRASKGSLLPSFTPAQRALLNGSVDFIAANAFTARYVSAQPDRPNGWRESKVGPSGVPIGPSTGVPWISVVPSSQADMLRYLSERYARPGGGGPPQLLISSSGVQPAGEEAARMPHVLDDAPRLSYYSAYLDSVCEAVASGRVRLLAWYAWSWMDGWEWTDGFTRKWGLLHVAYDGPRGTAPASPARGGEGLTRTPKDSARWLSTHFFRASAS